MEQELKKYIGNVDELIALFKQKVEIIESDNVALRARCDRYEKVLKDVLPYLSAAGTNGNHWVPIITEALAGEKEVDNG
jgi:hypothetical protein